MSDLITSMFLSDLNLNQAIPRGLTLARMLLVQCTNNVIKKDPLKGLSEALPCLWAGLPRTNSSV